MWKIALDIDLAEWRSFECRSPVEFKVKKASATFPMLNGNAIDRKRQFLAIHLDVVEGGGRVDMGLACLHNVCNLHT